MTSNDPKRSSAQQPEKQRSRKPPEKRRPVAPAPAATQSSRGSGDLEGITSMGGMLTFGGGSVQINVTVPASQSEGSSSFFGYAASDTMDPAPSSSNEFAHDAGRATNLAGTRTYTSDRLFTVKVTFHQNGSQHTLWGHVPATSVRASSETVSITLS